MRACRQREVAPNCGQELRRVARLGICDRQRGVEVGEKVARLLELVRERVVLQRDADDGDAGIHRRRELEEAPRPRQHRLRLHEHDGFGVAHVVEEVTQIAQVVGVEEDALAQLLLERALEKARLHRRLRLHVAHERAKLALARRRRGDRRQRRRRPLPLRRRRAPLRQRVQPTRRGALRRRHRRRRRVGRIARRRPRRRSGSRMARQRIGRRRLLEQRRRLLQPAAQLQQQREQAAHAEDDEQPTEERVHERARRSYCIQVPWYLWRTVSDTSVRQRASSRTALYGVRVYRIISMGVTRLIFMLASEAAAAFHAG